MKSNANSANDAIYKHIGQRVKSQREDHDFTQKRLGAELGVTFQQIQKYEKGVDRISAGRLYQIAKALNVPINAFYPSPNAAHSDDELTDLLDQPDAIRILRAYKSVCGIYRKFLIDQAEACANRWYPSCE
jgi:transcriptional regulator with XRE-family HTH domain